MTNRHFGGALLIGVSLISLAAAFLALPAASHIGQGLSLFLSRSAPVFWLVAVSGLVFASRLSIATHDRVGAVLGSTGVCLVAAYLLMRYIAPLPAAAEPDALIVVLDLSRFVLAPIVACILSVVTTILGWHLVMPQRPGSARSHVVQQADQPDGQEG